MLMFGVAIFSMIMGNFSEILQAFVTMNAELNDEDNLWRFFNMI